MSERISRRSLLRWSAISMGALALAHCAPQATPTVAPAAEKEVVPTAAAEKEAVPTTAPATVAKPAPAEGVTVTWWYAWGNLPPAVDRMMETDEFKDWMQGNKLEHKGSVTSEAILTAVAAGTPPDGGSNFDYPNLWARGAVLPVNDWVDASEFVKQDDILEMIWSGCFYDGQMIGVPGIETFLWYGLNYNEKLVKEAGLDPDNPPLTWEGLFEWHKALTVFDDAGNLLQMGFDPYDAMAGEPDFAATSWGFKWWDEEARTFNLNDPRMAEALDICGEFIRHVGPDKFQGLRQVDGQGAWGAAYNAEVQAMIMEGYWHPGETQIQQPDVAQHNRSTWAPVPASREGAKIEATGPHFVQLFKDGEHPYEMFKVSEFLLTDLALDIIFEEVGWIFGIKSWLETVDPTTYPGLDFYIKAANDMTEWIVGRRCPIHWYVTDQYAELREQVYRDMMTATEAAEELQKRALAEWEAQGLD